MSKCWLTLSFSHSYFANFGLQFVQQMLIIDSGSVPWSCNKGNISAFNTQNITYHLPNPICISIFSAQHLSKYLHVLPLKMCYSQQLPCQWNCYQKKNFFQTYISEMLSKYYECTVRKLLHYNSVSMLWPLILKSYEPWIVANSFCIRSHRR